MLGLLYKEIHMAKLYLWFVSLMNILLSIALIITSILFKDKSLSSIILIFSGLCMFTLIGLMDSVSYGSEDKGVWNTFISSTPGTMRAQILCKYTFIFIVYYLQFQFYYFLIACLSSCLEDFTGLLLMQLFCFYLLMEAIRMVFIIRFGAEHGKTMLMITILILIIIAFIYLLFGDISWIIHGNLKEKLMGWFNENNTSYLIALFPYFSLFMYYLSYQISIRIYRK